MKISKISVILAGIIGFIVSSELLSASEVVLDNTADLTATLSISLGSISTTNWNEKVFTTGLVDTTIDTISLALYATSTAGSYTVDFNLYEVNSGNSYVPSGTALATTVGTVTLTTSAAYYTFKDIFSSFSLASGKTYGLVINSTALGTNCSWPSLTGTSYPASNGFSYVTSLRTTNSGNTWGTNTYSNAMQVTVVPEPSTYAMMCSGLLLLALAVRRRSQYV